MTLLRLLLENLKIDPDIIGNKLDQETIRRGYFHASEDNKNAIVILHEV